MKMANSVKFRITESALKIFQQSGQDPKKYRPAYGGESAGLDLYNFGEEVAILGRNKWVAYGEKPAMIHTGVQIALPKGSVGFIKERSSITETGLLCRAGVIDPGFTGEIKVELINIGEKDIVVPTGAKLPLQLVVLPCLQDFTLVSDLEYLEETNDSKRGNNSLGSTN